MAEALAFYSGHLEFTLTSGGDDAPNSSLTRGDGRVMLETAADFYAISTTRRSGNGSVCDRRSRCTSRPRISLLSIPG